jgi:hypothetical protein
MDSDRTQTTVSPRRRGRPPIADRGQIKRTVLTWRTTPGAAGKLKERAKQAGRSVAQEVEWLVELGMIFEKMLSLDQVKLQGRKRIAAGILFNGGAPRHAKAKLT